MNTWSLISWRQDTYTHTQLQTTRMHAHKLSRALLFGPECRVSSSKEAGFSTVTLFSAAAAAKRAAAAASSEAISSPATACRAAMSPSALANTSSPIVADSTYLSPRLICTATTGARLPPASTSFVPPLSSCARDMASRMGSSLGVIDIRTKDMESNEIKTWSNTNICRCMLQRERTISQHALMLQRERTISQHALMLWHARLQRVHARTSARPRENRRGHVVVRTEQVMRELGTVLQQAYLPHDSRDIEPHSGLQQHPLLRFPVRHDHAHAPPNHITPARAPEHIPPVLLCSHELVDRRRGGVACGQDQVLRAGGGRLEVTQERARGAFGRVDCVMDVCMSIFRRVSMTHACVCACVHVCMRARAHTHMCKNVRVNRATMSRGLPVRACGL